MTKSMRPVALAFFAVALSASCAFFSPYDDSGNDAGIEAPGAGLFSWANYLYVVGGYDGTRTLRSEVWRGTVSADGTVGNWRRENDLPEGVAFAACVATGNMAYVIGGLDAAGPVRHVLFTLINPDGSLGFSSTAWESNPMGLPDARAKAAVVVVRGRVFLIGGQTQSKPIASVISASIWSDGQVGQWYESPSSLPTAGNGYSATLHRGELWVAGGGSSAVYRTTLDARGLPGSWTTTNLPDGAVSYPALGSTADGLILFGGQNVDAKTRGKTRVWDGSSWKTSADVNAWGPRGIVVANTLFAVSSVRGAEPPLLAGIRIASPAADVPLISPGSGIVRANTALDFALYPGDTLRYTTAAYGETPSEPTDSAAAWTSSSVVSATASYAFRAFRGNVASATVYEAYRIRASSLFVLLQDTLPKRTEGSAYSDYSLKETYSNGSSVDVSSTWYKIAMPSRSTVTLRWADSDDSPGGYTARVRVSLFEGDMYTPIRLADGAELYQAIEGATNPPRMTLGAGEYYLLVESVDGSTGGSFGLLLSDGE